MRIIYLSDILGPLISDILVGSSGKFDASYLSFIDILIVFKLILVEIKL